MASQEQTQLPPCLVCGCPAGQRCAGCAAAYYCGKEHQKQHWKKHRPACSPVKESRSAAMGRFLIAARSLAAGEVVLREAPLLEAPPPSTPPICLTCYRPLFETNAKDCYKCGWPMCSTECADSPKHAGECRLTVRKREGKIKISNFGIPHPSYQCMAALRCIALKETQPAKWRRLMEMESHFEERKGSARQEQERFGVAQAILRLFPKLKDDFGEDDILRICGVLQVNGHEVPLSEPPHVAVFDKCSLLAHACRANCCKSFTSSGELVVRTAVAVKAGEPLTICYTDPTWGTAARRNHLYDTKFFWCRCERCVDPTEFGTYFSALACPGEMPDCPGAIMPVDPLAEGGAPEYAADSEAAEALGDQQQYWRCSACDVSMPQGAVMSLLRRVGEDLADLDKDDPEACRLFLQRYGGEDFPLDLKEKATERRPLLSRDHFYLTDVRLALAQRYGQDGPDALRQLTDGELAHKGALCRRLLRLAETLLPAEHRMRGLLLFEMHAVEADDSRRKGLAQGADPGALRASLLESRRCLVEAVDLLRFEPEELPEGKILKQAKRNLKDIDQLLCALHHAVGDSPL